MSLSKILFSSIREEEIQEDEIQDYIFKASDEEEAYNFFKEELFKEQGVILVEGKEKEIEILLPF